MSINSDLNDKKIVLEREKIEDLKSIHLILK